MAMVLVEDVELKCGAATRPQKRQGRGTTRAVLESSAHRIPVQASSERVQAFLPRVDLGVDLLGRGMEDSRRPNSRCEDGGVDLTRQSPRAHGQRLAV
ncbi:hypothetical protein CB1_000249002 [Camelus ferus]|nr:hypothetical protein CB1_000249002 [Camelus ferus]